MLIENKPNVVIISLFDHIHFVCAGALQLNAPLEFYELTAPLVAKGLAHMNEAGATGRTVICFPFNHLDYTKAQFYGNGKQFGEWWSGTAKLYLNAFPTVLTAFPIITDDVLPPSLWEFAQESTRHCGADWIFPAVHNGSVCKVVLAGEGYPRVFP